MALTINRVPRSAQGYTEPLLVVADAIPLHMVLIPSGTFTMGSPESEPKRRASEGPQHEVTVPPFFMGHYPVTQAQWRVVAALPEINQALEPDPANFKGDNNPVEQVSWHEATEFCDRLTQHTGRSYRLPSEAEWEYACRAGTTTPFYFGSTLTDALANYRASAIYADGSVGKYREMPTPVDQFGLCNAFGLGDMHGNVWEWCADYFHNNYEGAPIDGKAWFEGEDGSFRIIRGGSWDVNPTLCRSAFRSFYPPEVRFNIVGFRVSCSTPSN
ncbi:MAG: formylglycine-generating enzyme family protein [Cyanobacteria bacterium J06555_13]